MACNMKFENYHPAINLIYFAVLYALVINYNHPAYVGLGFLLAVFYYIWQKGKKAVLPVFCVMAIAALYIWWYVTYHHFGITVLSHNFIGNNVTKEAIYYGFVRGAKLATYLLMFMSIINIFTVDKVVYLVGRVFPRLSLFISLFVRGFSRFREKTSVAETARCGIGLGAGQSSLLKGFIAKVKILSIVFTWTIEDYVESAQSMKNRGYTLKGRTAFSIYRFDSRDRLLVIIMMGLSFVNAMAIAFDQTKIYYDPEIVMNQMTIWSYVFLGAFAIMMLLPIIVESKKMLVRGKNE